MNKIKLSLSLPIFSADKIFFSYLEEKGRSKNLSTNLEIERFYNFFLKNVKNKKRSILDKDKNISKSSLFMQNFELKSYYSKIFKSEIEKKKTQDRVLIIQKVRTKMLTNFLRLYFKDRGLKRKGPQSNNIISKKVKSPFSKKLRLKSGVFYYNESKNYLLYNGFSTNISRKVSLLQFLRTRGFVKKSFRYRLLSFPLYYKGKNSKKFSIARKDAKKMHFLLTKYLLDRLDFLKGKKEKKVLFKKFVWKYKKQTKWKSFSIFNRFKNRQFFYQKFYLPRHIEINLKTFSFLSLGFFDSKSTYIKIPFWLDLRKLTTFLSR